MLRRTLPFAVVFALATVAGRATALPEAGVALFWPAAGVAALWGLVAESRREVATASVIVGVLSAAGNAVTGFPTGPAVLLGLANALIVAGMRGTMSWLRHRAGDDEPARYRLEGLTDLYRFLVATAVATAGSAGLGVAGLAAAGLPATWESALAWAVRNGAAVLVIAAPALAVRGSWGRPTRPALLEAALVLGLTLVVLWLVFGPGRSLPLGFVPLALVLWAGLRLPLPLAAGQGLLQAAGTLLLVSLIDGGLFSSIEDELARALTVQAYMTMAVGLALVLALVQREREGLLHVVADAARKAGGQAEDLRVITETIPDALVVIDRDGRVLLHNEAATQWIRTSEDGTVVHDTATVRARGADGADLDPEELPGARALRGETVIGAVMETDNLLTGEPSLVAVDAVPLHDRGRAPADGERPAEGEGEVDDEPGRVLLVVRDVSEEHARIRALEAERERTERLISDAPHGIAVLDMAGRVLQVNDSLAALAGRTVSQVVGTSFDELSPAHRDKIAVYLERAVAAPGDLLVGDWTIEGDHGEPVHVSLTGRVLAGADGTDDVILVNVVDFSERRRYEERLTYLADHDALTGLPNRRRFDETLDEHLRLCQRRGPTGALLLVDLDHFKEVNDSMGHGAGDDLIVAVGTLLRERLRATDLVARLGGDEFAILLPEADQEGAQRVADELVREVRAYCATLDGVKRRVTASIGVVSFAAAAQQSVDPLALVDMLLYDAKDAGRNRWAVLEAGGAQQPRTGARLEWMERVEMALETGGFELYLQPVLDVRADRIVGAEALLRLVDRGEPVAPGRFVHIAERAGLAPDVDRWVVRRAVEMLSRLHRIDPDLTLAVNLSGHSIGDPDVELDLVDALRRHGVPPQRVMVEATETAAVADLPTARAFAERLSAMGMRVAIDDFGAGFGSFYYLKHLPFDVVKIDGEFVAESHTSSVDRAILRSIVGIAQNLGKETVAEFVSDPAVLEVVRELGVDFAQGYLIGRPVPYDTFVATYLAGGSGAWTTRGPAARRAVPVGGEGP